MDQLLESLHAVGTGIGAPRFGGPERGTSDVTAAREFEAYLLKMLLAEMRKGLGSGGLFTSRTFKGYEAIMDDALARRAAEAGSFGLAEQMLRDWDRVQ